MHLVVFDAQVRDAGARALARFEIDQELPAVLRDVAQLVELGVVAARDDAAVAHHRGRLGAIALVSRSRHSAGGASAASTRVSASAFATIALMRSRSAGSAANVSRRLDRSRGARTAARDAR